VSRKRQGRYLSTCETRSRGQQKVLSGRRAGLPGRMLARQLGPSERRWRRIHWDWRKGQRFRRRKWPCKRWQRRACHPGGWDGSRRTREWRRSWHRLRGDSDGGWRGPRWGRRRWRRGWRRWRGGGWGGSGRWRCDSGRWRNGGRNRNRWKVGHRRHSRYRWIVGNWWRRRRDRAANL
jgi:hypothetical protein